MGIRLHSLALALGLAACEAPDAGLSSTHIGQCVLREPARPAPADPYRRTPVASTGEFPPFTKALTVCGVTLIARDDISERFMNQVADVLQEMFPHSPGPAGTLQLELLTHLHRHRTTIPFFHGDDFRFEPEDEQSWDRTVSANSICDIIMEGVEGQVMEVVEHILHHVTDVGLHFTFPEAWGLSEHSTLHAAMQEAISAGYYEIDQYDEFGADELLRRRVLLQEFAYWIITCAWDLQEPYGPEDSEWKVIRSSADLATHLPRSAALVRETLDLVLVPPSRESLDVFLD